MAIRRIGLATRTYRHINRYRQILGVLFRYGFDELVESMRIGQYLEIGWKLIAREPNPHVERLTTAQRVRHALEDLGPTFVKLGQVLSTRPDLVPPEFALEFSQLQQGVEPFAFKDVRATIEEELGQPPEEIFEQLEEKPLAAASIGQVHRARLRTGEDVVVKVQRPDIESTIEVDLEILLHLATLGEKHSEDLAQFKPSKIVQEFHRVIDRELDYRIEARHLERFAREFESDETVYVPKVMHNLTNRRVLTMEYVKVIAADDPEALRAAGLAPRVIANRGANATLKQILDHGFFHADPHPGNVFALPGNVVCFLDFGMMGRLDRTGRERFADLVYAVAQRDARGAMRALLHVTTHDPEDEPDPREIEADVAQFIDINVPETLGHLDFSRLIVELMGLIRHHRLTIPADLVMMMKAAGTAERLVRKLDPELNMIEVARPYVARLKTARFRPTRMMRDAFETGGDLLELIRDVPSGLRDILRLSKRGRLRIGFEHRGLEEALRTHERVANRLSFAIVAASLIVGSSLIVVADIPPKVGEVPLIGLAGYLIAGGMGLLLIISILRHGQL
jgi:ubiquinone biosynthesis protein